MIATIPGPAGAERPPDHPPTSKILKIPDPIIRFFKVSKRFGSTDALVDISFDIPKNEFLFISGPSGAGKSTLMKLLYMEEKLSGGYILLDGMNLDRIGRRQVPLVRRKLGVIFQDFKLIPSRTVYDNIALVLEVAGVRSRKMIRQTVMEMLRTVGMADRANAYPPTLSGGEQQRVAVGRAMVGRPKIIIADEPTASLDPDSAEKIYRLLVAAHAGGATVIITTHDRDLLARGSNIVFLEGGRFVDRIARSGGGIP